MGMNHFFQVLEERCIPDHVVRQKEAIMGLLTLVAYSWQERIGDVDFSSFTYEDAVAAMDELQSYAPDEGLTETDDEEGDLLTEINRVPHMIQKVEKIKVRNAKKKFI